MNADEKMNEDWRRDVRREANIRELIPLLGGLQDLTSPSLKLHRQLGEMIQSLEQEKLSIQRRWD